MKQKITAFNFSPGKVLNSKYEVIQPLGSGWESEVYLVREIGTGIERTAKFFFPIRNVKNKTANLTAKRFHTLRNCPILIRYHTQEILRFKNTMITFLVSEYIEGEVLEAFIKRQPGKKLPPFQALHLLYALASGLTPVHQLKEYHGDIHTENIIVQSYGLYFDLKVLDLHHWEFAKKENIKDDVCDMIRVFYDVLGGAKTYSKMPPVIKQICCGLKRNLILSKFKNAGHLKSYLETMRWDSP
ncbi:MAG: serine/threonine protein kinase [Bdellovibrionaceae bacterium]|nr:serine/threonine protein kinase [Pseudobdellovibrionaceae bacterium]|tara:strand:- start:1153 stop:1881 length:729 start_codon:yes stop_codon:yes gene_type:complete